MPEIRAPGRKHIVLGAVQPNGQTTALYVKRLTAAVEAMRRSYERVIERRYKAALKANEAAGRVMTAFDAAGGAKATETSGDLFAEMRRLQSFWSDYFEDFANKVANPILRDMQADNSRGWVGVMKQAGFDIKLNLTPSQTLILKAKTRENVALIKSIGQQYHTDIEGDVMRSFVAGRDLDALSKQLKARGKVTTERAAFIARDQANKATAAFNAARQRELSIVWARWIHSSAGKEPRPEHVRAGRERWYFKTQEGIDFNDKFGEVCPGMAINCRCTSVSIIPAFNTDPGFDESKLEPVPGFKGAYRMRK